MAEKLNNETFQIKLNEKFGLNEYVLKSNYENQYSTIEVLHTECGRIYECKAYNLLRGRRCYKCFGKSKRKKISDVKRNFELKGFTMIGEYVDSHKKVDIVCNTCGFKFGGRYHSICSKRNTGCPNCNKNISKGENIIEDYLNKKGMEFEKNYRPQEFKDSDVRMSYDFFIKEINTLIEYDGKQHFSNKNINRFSLSLVHNDLFKDKFAKENGYKLIRISYEEFNNLTDILDDMSKDNIDDSHIVKTIGFHEDIDNYPEISILDNFLKDRELKILNPKDADNYISEEKYILSNVICSENKIKLLEKSKFDESCINPKFLKLEKIDYKEYKKNRNKFVINEFTKIKKDTSRKYSKILLEDQDDYIFIEHSTINNILYIYEIFSNNKNIKLIRISDFISMDILFNNIDEIVINLYNSFFEINNVYQENEFTIKKVDIIKSSPFRIFGSKIIEHSYCDCSNFKDVPYLKRLHIERRKQ